MPIWRSLIVILLLVTTARPVLADPQYPPALPAGREVVTDTSPAFLQPVAPLRDGVEVAKTPPTIDFLYYSGQTYPGNPWSAWGDGLAIGGKYYSSIGDHGAPSGNAFVYEYDAETRTLRSLVELKKLLALPEGHYSPGKIHSRIDRGDDGWLYFSTHRGSTRVTTDRYHFRGDWIIRHHPETGRTEIVAHAPVPMQCLPASVLDPTRLIFYGGTAAGDHRDQRVMFFAYDTQAGKLLYAGYDGPARYLIFARSTGRVYYVGHSSGALMRYDPEEGSPPVPIPGRLGLRAATEETPDGFVYTVSKEGTLWRFHTRTEQVEDLGSAVVGTENYIATLDADPTGRYLYYVPGAHGSSYRDGTPVVQFDVKTRKRKIIAFLHPFYMTKYGYTPIGTYGAAVDPQGEKLYITWNGNRSGRDRRDRFPFDTCALTVVHIPESER